MEENYIVYKTTNLVNLKFYIGVHRVSGRNKSYLGSGVALLNAIKKYGRKNFIRETLREFGLKEDAYDYEKELVNESMINNPLCYNIVEGGGCPPTGSNEHNNFYGKKHSEESKLRMSKSQKGRVHSVEHKNKTSETLKERYKGKIHYNSRTWCVNGEIFYRYREAARRFGVGGTTILRWCKDERKPNCYVISKTI